MRRILAGVVLATAAFTVPFTGSASAGCIEDYILSSDDTEGSPIVVLDPDGSIHVYPPKVPSVTEINEEVHGTLVWVTLFRSCLV